MIAQGFLWADQGILGMGSRATSHTVGGISGAVFRLPFAATAFTVLHGRQELGFVDELTFLGKLKARGCCCLAAEPGM